MKIMKISEGIVRTFNREKKEIEEKLNEFSYVVLNDEGDDIGLLNATSSGYVNISLNFPSNVETKEIQKQLEEWLGTMSIEELKSK